ncbi:hypothetical protein [Streptomyces tsukubensis]|uniref:Uncharacterized protein n=1 Tax=Streptomyces tsukubensis TaxID=83656 RepID=A0A1V4A8F5_9ACTN|nr:hypothetical protein [Streptomyces tsukubensis]OON79171.1 hypothetical protein B1H18_14440 [Streptomyces tsukubensis]QFR94718.1 hypothetical protein GBW32_18770 [Streptomyces tsukubensis]
MSAEPVPAPSVALPSPWRLWAAASGIAGTAVLAVVAVGSTSAVLFCGSAVLAAVLLPAAYLVAKPWFVARSERWHRVITFVPMTAYAWALGLGIVVAVSLLPDRPMEAGFGLLTVWSFHIGGGVSEPRSFAYERLRGRLTWAAALHVNAMVYGTLGAVCLVRGLPVPERYATPVFATSVSVVLGVAGVSALRVFLRGRKLATELDTRAQKVQRCLERLSRCPVAERGQRRESTEDAWDDLHRTLHNKVETGFHLYGTFVIPPETTKELRALVEEAITDPGAPAHHEAVKRLSALRAACESKIDTVA